MSGVTISHVGGVGWWLLRRPAGKRQAVMQVNGSDFRPRERRGGGEWVRGCVCKNLFLKSSLGVTRAEVLETDVRGWPVDGCVEPW